MATVQHRRRVNPFNLETNRGNERAAMEPCRAFFGCENDGRGFADESDPTEDLNAPSAVEIFWQRYGLTTEHYEAHPEENLEEGDD